MRKRIAGIILSGLCIIAAIILILVAVVSNGADYEMYTLGDGWSMRGRFSDAGGSDIYITDEDTAREII